MKVLFYLGHPAHYHLFKNSIKKLGKDRTVVLIKSKDVLEKLLQEDNIEYHNVDGTSSKIIGKSTFDIALNFGKRIIRIAKIIRINKPYILAGSAAELAILGRLFRIPSAIFFEDDFEKVASFAKIAGPSATHLICPDCCSAWKWNYKKIGYNSYHELAYLHPDVFSPEIKKIESIFDLNKKNFIIRFSELGAYHDVGKAGITDEMALELIKRLEKYGKVLITSERTLPEQFEPYRITIRATDIHHALYFADMFIGDSQTMTAESAVLGTPALRFNDFVGELSYLENLEIPYNLTYGFKTNNSKGLFLKIDELLEDPNLKATWKIRKEKMLSEKINFTDYITNFLENYKR